MTGGPQATFVVEYPCDQFCSIEVELIGEPGHLTLQQMREKADELHRRVHEPEATEAPAPVVTPESAQRPAATVFRSAPDRGDDRRQEGRSRQRR